MHHSEAFVTDPRKPPFDMDPQWAAMHEASEILTARQFARRDVLGLTGLSDAQLKNTLDRDLVRLDSEHNPGTGRRRMFSGSDVLKLTVAHTMSAIGYPMRWSYLIADQVERRAHLRLIGGSTESNLAFAMYPNAAGDDWAFVVLSDQRGVEPLPVAFQLLNADALIDQTLAKLRALVADEPIPDFSFKFPEPEPPPFFIARSPSTSRRRPSASGPPVPFGPGRSD